MPQNQPAPYHLERFLNAQDGVFDRALAELQRGRKTTHWMWFVFPQIRGLGHSEMAQRYAISSLAEAKAYLDHPLLGARLEECTRTVCAVNGRSAAQIFGAPDDMKFKSSMTLFARAAPAQAIFRDALDQYFGGAEDDLTVAKVE